VAGVVGWVDFDAADAADEVARLARNPLLAGIRPMVQDMADDDWLAHPAHASMFEALVAHDLVFDALVLPRHLPRLQTVAERHPRLATVIDHGAKPDIRLRKTDPWRADMARLAALTNVHCKVSGLVTEAGVGWKTDDLRPYVDHLAEIFGPSRLIWGSDWPVCTLAAGYRQWHETAGTLLASLTGAERTAVFGGNAARLYLERRAG
jgi:L-fuconolactonase